jgi:NAD(P)-dependent dehydrogenase (short-subunit alcohol dehydrogenase family)
MANYFITGCSRGLGLAFATQLASLAPSNVGTIFATARSKTPTLHNLVESCGGRVVFIKLDVTNQSDISDAVKHVESTLQGRGLDVLINNAGILPFNPDGVQAMTDLDEVLHTNVTGAHMATSAFLPLLKDGKEKKVVNM